MNTLLENWLILHLSLAQAPKLKELLNQFEDANALVNADEKYLLKLGVSKTVVEKIKNPDRAQIKKALQFLEKSEHHLITYDHPNYPALLKETPDPPMLLYCWGNPEVFRGSAFAVVGSRNPTPGGAENAFLFSRELARSFVIVSGMAIGIDGESHRGALEAQGKTIAVLGCGLSHIYPNRHRALAQEIAKNGAVISEFPLETPPMAPYFPQRNRIISGMSIGTLVVEAALRSGSLITARFAMEQNREVFAIPGSIHAPQSRGCHSILKDGGKLVEDVDDIMQELGHFVSLNKFDRETSSTHKLVKDPEAQALLTAMGFDPVSVDQLVARLGLSAANISAQLLCLEIEGLVSKTPGGYVRLP